MMFGYKDKPNFTVENEAAIAKPPTVDFSKPPAAASQPSEVAIFSATAARGSANRVWQGGASPRVLLGAGAAAVARIAARSADVPVPPLQAARHRSDRYAHGRAGGALEQKLAAFEQRKGSQIAVLIVPTTQPETIEQYGIRVAEQWKLGRKGVDDGALLLVAKDDRALRIESRLRPRRPIARCSREAHRRRHHRSAFRAGRFRGGIDAGVDAMIKVVDGEPLPAPQWRGSRSRSAGWQSASRCSSSASSSWLSWAGCCVRSSADFRLRRHRRPWPG